MGLRDSFRNIASGTFLSVTVLFATPAVAATDHPGFVNLNFGSVQTDNEAFERNQSFAISIGRQFSFLTLEIGHQVFSEFYLKDTTGTYIDSVTGYFLNLGAVIPFTERMGLEPFLGVYTWEMSSVRYGLPWKESKGDSAQMGMDFYYNLLPSHAEKFNLRLKFGLQYMEKLSGPNVTQGQFGVQAHF